MEGEKLMSVVRTIFKSIDDDEIVTYDSDIKAEGDAFYYDDMKNIIINVRGTRGKESFSFRMISINKRIMAGVYSMGKNLTTTNMNFLTGKVEDKLIKTNGGCTWSKCCDGKEYLTLITRKKRVKIFTYFAGWCLEEAFDSDGSLLKKVFTGNGCRREVFYMENGEIAQVNIKSGNDRRFIDNYNLTLDEEL